MRRIAFFGGTFDPPHSGHLAIAKAAADSFALDQILFAPVNRQPLKLPDTGTPFLHRYAMTALAIQAEDRFYPSLLDGPQNGEPANRPNYTVDTLSRLRSSLATWDEPTELFMLLGADSWLELPRWHEPARLLGLADCIVASRPGFSLTDAGSALPQQVAAKHDVGPHGDILVLRHSDGHATRVHFLNDLEQNISATELRESLHSGTESSTSLLPASVREYIRKTGLYR